MRTVLKLIPLACLATGAFGQLTLDQKMSDFQNIVAVYDKNYGPYDWKKLAFGYDLLSIAPWVDKIRATKDDLDFYEVLSSYVASLNDAHDVYELPSNFTARLNFGVDIYDGKLLVDTITRTRLPAAEFPFQIGYELVSIDGKDAQTMLDGLLHYEIAANPRSTRRLAAQLLTIRPQFLMPHAADVPEVSTVVFRRPDGTTESHRIPWTKTGLALTAVGKYITPNGGPPDDEPVSGNAIADTDPTLSYMQPLLKLWNCRLPDREVNGFGSQFPIFANALPAGFTVRLGRSSAEIFFSGTFQAGGHTIGFIRIPDFAPADPTGALTIFQREIDFFEKNTDGVIVDVMRNPGGSVAYLNQILSKLIFFTWRSLAFELRATPFWVADISSSLEQAKAAGAPPSIINLLQAIKDQIVAANEANRGRTPPIPLDDVTIDRAPATDSAGNRIASTKPLLVLIDELTASAGDAFAATIQDNWRGLLFGRRTMGAGGNVVTWEAGSYSQGIMTLTESLMNRKFPVQTLEYPEAPYVENIGVYPDFLVDYMTQENLAQNGKPFVDAFVATMVAYLNHSF